ncbi:hypothetical protein LEP1GSC058_2981 [Leptospira fainei serovar Hurstbridge str. BUT 6]|uniref:Exonuclease n=1 Tax=Leptospira fainei serovar Hurstbridge str. BUT 6 TaxID=1193011 RepID=S3UX38_9LEPT|nr:hypothetical protein [Leptospira fainei]EPG73838.1 hypothetical protein LEP1GSC058_2981 [Leptospira fainei serovar Hurstbridge str. BUT 6]
MKAETIESSAKENIARMNHPSLRMELKIHSGPRSYFDTETESLLTLSRINSRPEGLSDGKLPTLNAEIDWDRKTYSRVESLLKEGLVVLVPRIKYRKEKREGEVVLHLVSAKGDTVRDREAFKNLILEIHRRSAWAVRNYTIENQTSRNRKLDVLLDEVLSGKWIGPRRSSNEVLIGYLERIRMPELIRDDAVAEAEEQIDAFMREEGFVIPTKNFGYVYVPEAEADSLFKKTKNLYKYQLLPKLTNAIPTLENEIRTYRESFLDVSYDELIEAPILTRDRMFVGEWHKFSQTIVSSFESDILAILSSIGTKAIASEEYKKEMENRKIDRSLRQALPGADPPMARFLRLEGADFSGTKLPKSLEEDSEFLSIVYFGAKGPCLCVCPNSEATVLAIFGQLEDKYSFESETALSFLLMIYARRNRIGTWFNKEAFREAFCGAALACLGKKVPWLYRMAFFVGFRESLLSEVFHVLSVLDYDQLDRKLEGENQSRRKYDTLRQEFLKVI